MKSRNARHELPNMTSRLSRFVYRMGIGRTIRKLHRALAGVLPAE